MRKVRVSGRMRPEVVATVIAAVLLLLPIWAARSLIMVADPETRVALKAYPADLVYGAEPTQRPAPDLQLPPVLQPVFRPFDPGPGGGGFVPRGICDPAGPNVFPSEPAAFDVRGRVEPGRYLWQQDGTIELATFKLDAPAFTSRTIKNIQDAGDGAYTYDVESTSLIGRRVETILVEPGRAISLTAITIFATDGNRRDFRPVTPVELLPLPVTIGGTVTGAGVDPVNLRTMLVQGTVTGRMRVDACGEIIDAWLVEGTREFRDRDNPTAAPGRFDYAIAPQFGGLFVFDHIVENGTTATDPPLPYSFDVEASIGTLEPEEVNGG